MISPEVRRAIEATFRIERARLIGGLARLTHDVDHAEEFAQEALVTALDRWARTGIPRNPGAWLMRVAKNRAIDEMRREAMRARKHASLMLEMATSPMSELDDAEGDAGSPGGDELLGLVFAACHPVLSPDARTALTLRVVGGLTTDEIARAFVLPEPTIAQRIVRAKKVIKSKGVSFFVPHGQECTERLTSVLEVVYLIFNEGYSATSGDDVIRRSLIDEALRLGRILAALMPDEAEVWGLLSLMELQASRTGARTGADGLLVPITSQNRGLWDQLLILRGLRALERARTATGSGRYVLQAAVAACHACARTAEETNWRRIIALYEQLALVSPSPIVGLNHAIAYSMVFGPEAGLRLIEKIPDLDALVGFAPLSAARADFLLRAGKLAEAQEEFTKAAALTRNARERDFFLARAKVCEAPVLG